VRVKLINDDERSRLSNPSELRETRRNVAVVEKVSDKDYIKAVIRIAELLSRYTAELHGFALCSCRLLSKPQHVGAKIKRLHISA
jgi:hypothetical protein